MDVDHQLTPLTEEATLTRCRRLAVVLNEADPERKSLLAHELADLLRLLEAHAVKQPDARAWLDGEAVAIRDSVLTPDVRRYAPAWAGPLLLPQELVEAMVGDGPEEYE